MHRFPPTIVLVHGAWHDERCWSDVTAHLSARRVRWATLTLPSTDPGRELPGFADDVASVVELLDRIEGEVTLCGHAYGGMVISEAGNHDRVSRLVYLAAQCPLPGDRVIDLVGPVTPIAPFSVRRAKGTMRLRPRVAKRILYPDLSRSLAASKASMLRPSTASIFKARATDPAWLRKETTYVACRRDRAISSAQSRRRANLVVRQQLASGRMANHAATLETGHSPFYSAPGHVADLLINPG